MEATGSRRLSAIARHLVLHPVPMSIDSSTSNSALPVVIGAMVADIHSYPSTPLSSGTTVIGQVQIAHGGVGRNVAECMAKLGVAPFLISVVGEDMAGNALVEHWRSLGLETRGIRRCHGLATPVISLVFDTRGEVAAGVADTEAVETHLTPEWISQFVTVIQAAPIVLLDANLSPASLEIACKLAREAHVPVWFEPVSVSKSVRATGLYQYLTYVSPNEKELVAMGEALVAPLSGDSRTGSESREERSIELLLEAGVEHVVVTLGSRGSIACTRSCQPVSHADVVDACRPMMRCFHVPALAARVVSLSGAGDCLVAGCIAWLAATSGGDVVACLAHGTAAAKQAVESRLNVPDMASVAGDAEAARRGARELTCGDCRDMLLAYAWRE